MALKTSRLAMDDREKRFDPLVTLGLMLDGSGFVRRSEVFEAVFEGKLCKACSSTQCPRGLWWWWMLALPRGQHYLAKRKGFKYLVVSRQHKRVFDQAQASQILSACGHEIFCIASRQNLLAMPQMKGSMSWPWLAGRARGSQGSPNWRQGAGRFESELRQLNEDSAKRAALKNVIKLTNVLAV